MTGLLFKNLSQLPGGFDGARVQAWWASLNARAAQYSVMTYLTWTFLLHLLRPINGDDKRDRLECPGVPAAVAPSEMSGPVLKKGR